MSASKSITKHTESNTVSQNFAGIKQHESIPSWKSLLITTRDSTKIYKGIKYGYIRALEKSDNRAFTDYGESSLIYSIYRNRDPVSGLI